MPSDHGEDCVLVKVHAAEIGELERTLDQFLLHGQTVTSIVVSTPVPPRPLPVSPPVGSAEPAVRRRRAGAST